MNDEIRNRNPRWEKKSQIMLLLANIRKMVMFWDIIDDDFCGNLVWFILDQFPVADEAMKDGEVTKGYANFINQIPDLEPEEFYNILFRKKVANGQ